MVEGLLFLSLSVFGLQTPPEDPGTLRREARRTAFRYEAALRRHAPPTLRSAGAGPCDEVIGRFCFRFTDDAVAPPDTAAEPPAIPAARRRAIRAYRAWLAAEPGSAEAAGALVRFLIEDHRAPEAVPLARTHVSAAGATPGSLLLLGLAHHEAGDVVAAESAFDEARALLPAPERARLDDVEALLAPREQRAYRDLGPTARTAYNRRFWAFSDPSLLEPGNERRSAHYARRAWSGILAGAPAARGRVSWGRDTEEIVLRYGLPTYRERVRPPPGRFTAELSVVEYFDRHAVAFTPEALSTEGLPVLPAPGAPSPLDRDTVRSSYAPVRLHRTRPLEVTATRVWAGDAPWLVVTGLLRPDSGVPVPRSPAAWVGVADLGGRWVGGSAGRLEVGDDSVVRLRAAAALPAPVRAGAPDRGDGLAGGSWVIQVELLDTATEQRALARYRVVDEGGADPAGGPRLSGPLLTLPGAVRGPGVESAALPWAGLRLLDGVVPVGSVVGLWAEVGRLERRSGEARYRVEWWVEEVEERSGLGRALRWLGRRLGLGEAAEPVRVGWSDRSTADPVPVELTLDLSPLEPGLYRLGLRVVDVVSGRGASSTRLLRVAPGAPPLPGPTPTGPPGGGG